MSDQSRSSFASDVIPLIGQAAAAELVRRLGGTTFPVPMRQTAAGEVRYRMLATVVGEDAATILCENYGGDTLYIPRGARAIQQRRDAAIHAEITDAIRAGRPMTGVVNELALKYQLTDRRIWEILKVVPTSDNQYRLI